MARRFNVVEAFVESQMVVGVVKIRMADITFGEERVSFNFRMPAEESQMTLGEDRVRVTFNPTANTLVDTIKQDTAKLIDRVDGLKFLDPRLAALAQTAYEEAAMWAVKLATTPPRPPRPAA